MIREILSGMRPIPFAYRIARWHLRYLLARKPGPLACGFYITSKCNFKCEFCNIWRLKPSFIVGEEDARNTVSQLGGLGLTYFSISGGEPLLVPYVFDLLAYAKECGILYTHVVSNGFLMDVEAAKSVASANISEVSFSIDGPEKVHDEARGAPGAFQRVLCAVENIKAHAPATKIVLNTILSAKNPEHALYAMRKACDLDVSIKFQPANDHPVFDLDNPADSGKKNLSENELGEVMKTLDVLEKEPHVANSRPFITHFRRLLLSRGRGKMIGGDCIFGYHHLEFFNNRLFPCLEGLDWEGGFEAYDRKISDILSSREYCNTLDRLRRCQGCMRNYYICYYEPRLNFPIWNFLISRTRTG